MRTFTNFLRRPTTTGARRQLLAKLGARGSKSNKLKKGEPTKNSSALEMEVNGNHSNSLSITQIPKESPREAQGRVGEVEERSQGSGYEVCRQQREERGKGGINTTHQKVTVTAEKQP